MNEDGGPGQSPSRNMEDHIEMDGHEPNGWASHAPLSGSASACDTFAHLRACRHVYRYEHTLCT